ncbi:hypothetical protein HYN48_13615 [Flavobacterium magnum]|uniref:RES domain-containing protein n=2 Tax=Flavobacterium magnum TaxID=2162713 RepID=A0A2S0RHA2_9FLAO|nr:hypothetical protein HYN48_13615 [Flavobacterium magnum]
MSISTSFFRARIVTNIEERDLETVKCIYYPDWSEIDSSYQTFGRCNDKGQNFFYCSNYFEATLKELNPNHKDLVMVGTFDPKIENTKIRCQFAGIETLKRYSHSDSILQNYQYQNERDRNIEKFIGSKFQEKILPHNDFQYKLTIAFSNILLNDDDTGCLIYPSVASGLKYSNYGIKPNYVDELLYCTGVYIYRVEKSNFAYTLIPYKYSSYIHHNLNNHKTSIIDWKENNRTDKVKRYSL